MDELGAAFDAIRDVARTAGEIFDALQTGKDVCDGACVVLGAVSVIPGAAAFTGPVIGIYQSMRPALVAVIDVGGSIIQVMGIVIDVMDALDSAIQGDFEGFINEASGLAQQAGMF